MNTQLKEFFISKISKPEYPDIDWDDRKTWWLDQLDKLYDQVETWLGELKDLGVTLERVPRPMYEDRIGDYEAHALVIKAGAERVEFDPVGTIVIAARGRVDIKGANGKAMLVLFPKGERPQIEPDGEEPRTVEMQNAEPGEYEWCIARHGGPRPVYVGLNEKTFLEVLRAVMGDDA